MSTAIAKNLMAQLKLLGMGAAFGINHRPVFDAAGLRVDGRHVGAEGGEHLIALAGLGGDDGENMDHGWQPLALE